ncbi:MAG: hypothetical protein K0R54_5529 [Clostridiaceae bacterium]|jgi:CRISPR/Cas system-associated protein Cas5 (RAMP superfamily)|nr:hypothetical protein [Clostridiaceae bacterium]
MKFRKFELAIFIGILTAVILPSIYIWYSLYQKNNENSLWTIGVGLFGALSGGICTLIAVIISTQETRRIQEENMKFNNKQLTIGILNEKIKDYKKTKDKLNYINRKISELYCLEPFNANNIGKRKILSVNSNYKQYSFELIKFIEDDFSSYSACISDVSTEVGLAKILSSVTWDLTFLCYCDDSEKALEIVNTLSSKTSKVSNYISHLQNQIKSFYFEKYLVD